MEKRNRSAHRNQPSSQSARHPAQAILIPGAGGTAPPRPFLRDRRYSPAAASVKHVTRRALRTRAICVVVGAHPMRFANLTFLRNGWFFGCGANPGRWIALLVLCAIPQLFGRNVTKKEDLWSLRPVSRPEIPRGASSSTNPI